MVLVATQKTLVGKFTFLEQVYKEIDLHDAVLVAQLITRMNLVKANSPKRVQFTDTDDQSGQKYIDDL